jgi:hypothetical protein
MFGKPQSLGDIGCGLGEYCKIFKEEFKWACVVGYEGTDVSKINGSYDYIYRCDLTKKDSPNIFRPFELVLCIEVGEHIPQEHEAVFLDNLVRCSMKWIVMSWAPPGQRGTGHVNPQEQKHVVWEMKKRGFDLVEEKTGKLRESADFSYLKRNLLVFVRGR